MAMYDAFSCVVNNQLPQLIEALDTRPERISFVDTTGGSLLQSAIISDASLELIEELIRRGVDLNKQDNEGRTAIEYAVVRKRRDAVELILKSGGRLNISNSHGNRPLWYAVNDLEQDEGIIRLLLAYDTEPYHLNIYQRTAFDMAVKRGSMKIINLLSSRIKELERSLKTE
jgi:ankyrin repeat protein